MNNGKIIVFGLKKKHFLYLQGFVYEIMISDHYIVGNESYNIFCTFPKIQNEILNLT